MRRLPPYAPGTGLTGVLAARFARAGGPEVLHVDEVPEPRAPRGDELLVAVAASSVNGTDLGLRRGELPVATLGRMPFVPGFDLAGTVLACGPAATAFSPGDRVVALLGHGGGAQAQRVLLRQFRAARVPPSVRLELAAALPLAGLTALQALYGRARLRGRRSLRVLVNGASGGIGAYGVQLAALAGAHVTGLASGPRLDFVRELGADEAVDRHRLTGLTDLSGPFDVVLDAPGVLALAQVRPVLAADGVMVSTRPLGRDAVRALPRAVVRAPGPFAAVFTRARSQDLAHLLALVDSGQLRPPVDRVLPLAEVAEAHRVAEGGVRGKVVVALPALDPALQPG